MRQSLRHMPKLLAFALVLGGNSLGAQAQDATPDTQINIVPPSEAPAPTSEPVVTPAAPYETTPATGNLRYSGFDGTREPQVDTSTTRTTFPNRPLLTTGSVLLLSSYLPAVIMAAKRDDVSKNLYYPVAGPWMELKREDQNTTGKTLLIIDGAVQGLGALAMLTSLVIPEKNTENWYLIGSNRIQLAPRVARNTFGLGAAGRF